MYSLDINFLNDRPELKPEAAARLKTRPTVSDSKTPLYLGVAGGVFLLGAAGALWFVLQNQNQELQRQADSLDQTLGTLKTQKEQLAAVNTQIGQVQGETKAFATVFNQVKPLSALVQDIRDRLPPSVQLTSVTQTIPPPGAAAPPPSPAASPGAPAAAPVSTANLGDILISGQANAMSDVNDFLLTLQRSAFVKPKDTQIIRAEAGDRKKLQPVRFKADTQAPDNADAPALPGRVQFQIRTVLNDVPASELLSELDRKGAVGLQARIRRLQQEGIIQPPKGTTKP